MRKILLSVTAAVALAVPLALSAGTASAAPANLTGSYYTNVGHQMHLWHVAHMEHLAYLGY